MSSLRRIIKRARKMKERMRHNPQWRKIDSNDMTHNSTIGMFSELEENYNPKTILIHRKTKAGKWELIRKLWYKNGVNKVDIASLANKLQVEELRRAKCVYDVAYKVTAAKGKDGNTAGKQIYCTKYRQFLNHLCDGAVEGIIIDKKAYIPIDRTMNVLRKLCKEHKGIKLWKEASDCKIDNHLIWGHLVMNDGFSVSIAFIGTMRYDLDIEFED